MCVPNYEAKCGVWGDPHYNSFDGLNVSFHGTCSYLLAGSVCPGLSDDGLTPFKVITKHESQGNPAVSNVKKVTVTTYNSSIDIHKKAIGRVQVRSGRSSTQRRPDLDSRPIKSLKIDSDARCCSQDLVLTLMSVRRKPLAEGGSEPRQRRP